MQAPPPIMQSNMPATVHINCGMNANTRLEASTKSDMEGNRLVIHMQTFKATDKSNSILHPNSSLIWALES
jgi:hypothetical protein